MRTLLLFAAVVATTLTANSATAGPPHYSAGHANRTHGYGRASHYGHASYPYGHSSHYGNAAYYGRSSSYYRQPYASFHGGFRGWGGDGGHHHWHDTSHYDYHPGGYVPHYNHYDYVPGHWDYHHEGHLDHH